MARLYKVWTLVASKEIRIQASENKCLKSLLQILFGEYKTNDFVRCTVDTLVGHQEFLLAKVKWYKLVWFADVTWTDTSMKTALQDCPWMDVNTMVDRGGTGL